MKLTKQDGEQIEQLKVEMMENFVKAAEAKEPNREQEFLDKTLQDAKKPLGESKPVKSGSAMDITVVDTILRRVAGKAMDLQAIVAELIDTVKNRGLTAEYLHGEMEMVKTYEELKAILEKPPLEEKDISRFAYFHRIGEKGLPRGNRYTVAYERTQITLQMLSLAVLNPKNTFEIRMGVAFCHTHDRFNKRIGREFAVSRIRPKDFKLVHVAMPTGNPDAEEEMPVDVNKTFFSLRAEDGTEIHGHVFNDTNQCRFNHIWVP